MCIGCSPMRARNEMRIEMKERIRAQAWLHTDEINDEVSERMMKVTWRRADANEVIARLGAGCTSLQK
jgi:hypothetical protein